MTDTEGVSPAARYRAKPVEVEAVRWDGTADTLTVLAGWGADPTPGPSAGILRIWGARGYFGAYPGDWLVRDADGATRWAPDEFEAKFAPVAAGDSCACGPLLDQAQAALEFERERAEAAEAKAGAYESGIAWGTSCLSCSAVLDSCLAETFRREGAEAKLAEAVLMLGGVRETVTNFLGQYGHSGIPMFKVGQDLANAVLKIIGAEREENPDA